MLKPRTVLIADANAESTRQVGDCLRAHDVVFSEKNTATHAEYAAFVRQLCGIDVSPLVWIGERWLPEPSQEEMLNAAGVGFDPRTLQSRGQTSFDVVVVGLGPAGLAACHGCRLGGLSVLGLDQNEPGGHLLALGGISQYLGVGYEDVFTGPDMAQNFTRHAQGAGAVLMRAGVSAIQVAGGLKRIESEAGRFWARAVIVATGSAQRELHIEGVRKFLDKGVRYAAQFDPHVYATSRVCVVGGGDEAMHTAVLLGQHAKHVTVLCPDDLPTGDPVLVQRAVSLRVRIINGASILAVRGDEALNTLFFAEKGVEEEQSLPVEAIVIALGPAPKSPIAGLEKLPLDGGFFAHGEGGKTTSAGVYVAGDCTNIGFRTLQGVVASGGLCAKRAWQWLGSNPLPRIGGETEKGRTMRITRSFKVSDLKDS